ncbi:thermonuclease family protein [Psychromarinibacter sp. C21-152]|uniref:Thermonuclease family protein n=1 Tax=Psychromarinibacter sediminicola TaxID=3033385 RepID=A0AAE3NN61_9RHOB|nr:thermonuclease family protein [Psychromarinibacter sediminicola]MDF0600403.1 thermonuclease family protein [Psychromarinibacter sediminicola]
MGFSLDGVIEKVTDGDTLRITAEDRLFKIRVLGLDTEESNQNQHKPVTAWGKAASDYTKSLLPVDTPVTIEFPGDEPAIVDDEINVTYLDNYQRPLGFVHLSNPVDGITDFTELMIRKGYSPYFVKYGRAVFAGHDARYAAAERAAQIDNIGVWNQLDANGAATPEAAPRNYPRLMVWWELRARVIDVFRAARAEAPDRPLFNTRIDYARLLQKAAAEETATVFMELKEGRTVGGLHYLIDSGSLAQPFQLFLPNEDRPEIAALKSLLANRYIADGEDFPRRNYAYVTGPTKMYNGRPEMVVESIDQVSDTPPDA